MVEFKHRIVGLALGGLGLLAAWGVAPSQAMGQLQHHSRQLSLGEVALGSESLKQTASQTYTRAMLTAYAAAEQGDYHTALINFRRALAARPGDRYARAGIRNMETYIAQERAEAAKQAEIARLEKTLAAAVAANDWACAAASVDRLIVLVPPTSLDRARLIAYRGELTGMIDSRANLDQWSTVCPGGQV